MRFSLPKSVQLSEIQRAFQQVGRWLATYLGADGVVESPKVWVGTALTTSGVASVTMQDASLKPVFTKEILSISAIAQRDTSTVAEMPSVSVKSINSDRTVITFNVTGNVPNNTKVYVMVVGW